MALDMDGYDCCVSAPLDWDWELRTLGAGDAAAQGGIHDAFPAMLGAESPVSSSSEASSGGGGYLEDAVADWSDRCKRQRMAAATVNEDLQCLLQSFWDSSSGEGDLLHDSNIMIRETSSFVSEEDDASGREQGQGQGSGGEGGPSAAAAQGGGEAGPPPSFSATGQVAAAAPPRPLQLQKATAGAPARGSNYYCCSEPSSSRAASGASSSSCSSLAGKEDRGMGVLYPFAVVKPLGLDGTTLNDVNRRILKRPARPVRHPVGAFACSPAVSAHGLGLSGKAVVSLTRIRTEGKGTITIIRTRG